MNTNHPFLILVLVFLSACSYKIGEELMAQITKSETDSVIITPQKALFIFQIDQKESWQWYNDDVSAPELEYGWWTNFELGDNKYSCGYYLYKVPQVEQTSGSFSELIESGQTNLESREEVSTKKIPDGYVIKESIQQRDVQINSIVRSNRLIIVLEEQDVIDQFRDVQPDSIIFNRKQSASNRYRWYKVAVNYSTQ